MKNIVILFSTEKMYRDCCDIICNICHEQIYFFGPTLKKDILNNELKIKESAYEYHKDKCQENIMNKVLSQENEDDEDVVMHSFEIIKSSHDLLAKLNINKNV